MGLAVGGEWLLPGGEDDDKDAVLLTILLPELFLIKKFPWLFGGKNVALDKVGELVLYLSILLLAAYASGAALEVYVGKSGGGA